jgi:hypothetical protein
MKFMKENCYLIENSKCVVLIIVVIAVRGRELRNELRIRIRKGTELCFRNCSIWFGATINAEATVILATG